MRRFIYYLAIVAFFGCNNVDKKEPVIVESINSNDELNSEDIELEVYDFNGLKDFLYREDEKTYVVNFWATWCAPCIKELPYFEKVNHEFKNSDVEVILVSLDFPKKYESKLKPFIKKNDLQSKVIALDDTDQNTWIPGISEDWSGAIPATLIYNRDKRQFYEKSFSYDELVTEINNFKN